MDDLYARARELASVSARESDASVLVSTREARKEALASAHEFSQRSPEPGCGPTRESAHGSLVVGFNLAALGLCPRALGCDC